MGDISKICEKVKENLNKQSFGSIYETLLNEGLSAAVRRVNKLRPYFKEEKDAKLIKNAINILMNYFNNYCNGVKNSLKSNEDVSKINKLENISKNSAALIPLEKLILEIKKGYLLPQVMEDGFMIIAAQNVINNFKTNFESQSYLQTKKLIVDSAYKAVEYLGVKVPTELAEARIELRYLKNMPKEIR
ncbi:MAG: hypothetical protein KKA61_02985 [Nanoarchaeota archaeon]|nr:hypothetical protein [Nanoarchaeota archaeon]